MGRTILVIDDDKLLDRALTRALPAVAAGVEVITACTGKEGIELAEKTQPDIIVLDISLPRECGWDIAERLATSEATSRIPILVASGAGSPFEDQPHIEKRWIAGYLRKPYDAEELMASVDKAMQLSPNCPPDSPY